MIITPSKVFCLLAVCLLASTGCQTRTDQAKNADSATGPQSTSLVSQVVEASCGQCQFKMKGKEGSHCDLAIRIEGKGYFVDGSKIDDHGDAHGDDGMCNCIRQAKVTGEIKDGRFAATSFEVLPLVK